MRSVPPLPVLILLASATLAAQAPEPRDARVVEAVARVQAADLQATVAKLVSFGTRHTLSRTDDPARGIGAARTWLASAFGELAHAPGSRLQPFEDRFIQPAGPRMPSPAELVNVGAILPGTDPRRAKEAIVLTGHYDSRVSDVMNATADAPGADDDGSGTAMALEAAKALAAARPAVSIYFVAVAGEEQGLFGSAHLAKRLQEEGITVLAMLSVDIAGNTRSGDGRRDSLHARIWSEGVPETETPAQRRLRLALGNEGDSPAREWARYLARVGGRYVDGLELRVMRRRDRIARGSDHMSFSATGAPAACLREGIENYDGQHQDVRVEEGRPFGDRLEGFDAPYAAKLCRTVVAAFAELASAPEAPSDLVLGGAVSPDAKLKWTLPADPRIAGLVLYRRAADTGAWQRAQRLAPSSSLTLPGVAPDDSVFALATVDAEGHESLPAEVTHLQ
jgi:hypothetical protein